MGLIPFFLSSISTIKLAVLLLTVSFFSKDFVSFLELSSFTYSSSVFSSSGVSRTSVGKRSHDQIWRSFIHDGEEIIGKLKKYASCKSASSSSNGIYNYLFNNDYLETPLDKCAWDVMVGINRFTVCKECKSLVIAARIEALAKEESKNVGRLENFSPDVFLEQGAILIIPRDLIPITNNRFAICKV